jgi:hypothetical protein
MSDYEVTLITNLTREWSFGDVTADRALDLPKETYEFLAKACQDELRGTNVDADPDPNQPAPTVA